MLHPRPSSPASRPAWAVPAALVLVQVFFGLHYMAAKLVLREIPPAAWALLRVSAAAVLLLVACRALGRRLPTSPSILGRLGLLSILGVVINQLCFVEGLSRTTPTHSALINTTIPVATALFATLLGREHAHGRRWLGIGLASAGVLLILQPFANDVAGSLRLGDLLTLINALSYSLFLVLSKPVLGRVDPFAATAVLMGFGTLGMLVPGLPALAGFRPAAVSATAWLLGLGIVLFPTVAAYLLTYWALARVESSAVAFFIYLQPLIATSLSVLLLGERPGAATLAGAGLIFAALYLTLRPGPPRNGSERGDPPREMIRHVEGFEQEHQQQRPEEPANEKP